MSSKRSMVRIRLLSRAVLTALLILPAGAVGQSSFQRGNPERQGRAWVERCVWAGRVREGGRLVLRADFGSVVVKAGAGERMVCQVVLRVYTSNEILARRQFDSCDLGVRTLEGGVYVNGKLPDKRHGSRSLDADFNITLPSRFNLDIETQGGNIRVENPLQGDVRATTAGGDIRTRDVTGSLRAETAGGSIVLGKVGNGVKAETAGGSIRVGDVTGDANLETSGGEIMAGLVQGAVHAETAGGDIILGGASGSVNAQTAGGQIRIGESGGSVRAETAGGSILVQGARGRVVVETAGGSIDLFQIQGAIKASTVAGRILAEINCNRKTFGPSQLETSMGDVQVFLPPDLPLTIDAAIEMAAGHGIVSDFPLVIRGGHEMFVQGTISGRGDLNGGGQKLYIRTVNGNIEIRKLDSRTIEQLKGRQGADRSRAEARRLEIEERRREREQEREELRRERGQEGEDRRLEKDQRGQER